MPDVVADAYATMAQFRLFLRITATTDATDADTPYELLALEAAARSIEAACHRTFAVAAAPAAARVFGPPQSIEQGYLIGESTFPRTRAIVQIDDLADADSVDSVKFDYTGNGDFDVTTTAYRAGPTNNEAKGLPNTQLIFDYGTNPPRGEESVEVTAEWGWAAIPNTIVNANLLQAARYLKRRDAAFGVAGSPEMGNELRLLRALDVDVALMVAPFIRHWGAV